MKAHALRIISAATLALGLTSCVGYVQGDGGGAVVEEPDVYLWGGYGGGYFGGYDRRGHESRAGGHPDGHAGERPAQTHAAPAAPHAAPAAHAGGGERR